MHCFIFMGTWKGIGGAWTMPEGQSPRPQWNKDLSQNSVLKASP